MIMRVKLYHVALYLLQKKNQNACFHRKQDWLLLIMANTMLQIITEHLPL